MLIQSAFVFLLTYSIGVSCFDFEVNLFIFIAFLDKWFDFKKNALNYSMVF